MTPSSNVIIARGTDVVPINDMHQWPVGQAMGPDKTFARYLGLAHIEPPRQWINHFQNIDIVDMAGYTMVDPEPAFYLNMPYNARAMFSTLDGKYAKREVLTVRRSVWKWLGLKIYQKALQVRQQFPLLMRHTQKPQTWMDLYHYFDAHDIYNFGPYNLWNVISLLHEQNLEIEPGVQAAKLSIVEEWIDQWMNGVGNPQLLESWTLGTDIISILHPGDFSYGGVGQLDEPGLTMLREALERKYHEHMMNTQRAQVQTWLSTTVSPPRDDSPPLLPITEEPTAEEATEIKVVVQPVTPPEQRASSAPGSETKPGTAEATAKAARTVSAQPDLARDGSPLANKPVGSAKKSVGKTKSPSSSAGDSWKSREFFGSGKKKPHQPVVQPAPGPVIVPAPLAALNHQHHHKNNTLGVNGFPMPPPPPQMMPHLPACPPPPIYAPQMGPVSNVPPVFQGMPVVNPAAAAAAQGAYPGPPPFEAPGFHQQPLGPSPPIFGPPLQQQQQQHPDGMEKPHIGRNPIIRYPSSSHKLDPTREGWKPKKFDPLHGPTYSRDRHNGESAIQTSSSGAPGGGNTQTCLNVGRAGLFVTYLECYCSKCGPAQRSIVANNFLRGVTLDSSFAAKLLEHFSKYEYVDHVSLNYVKRYAHVRFLSPDAAASVVNLAKRNKVDGISDSLQVKFPFYSKNFQPHTGGNPYPLHRVKPAFNTNGTTWRNAGPQLPSRQPSDSNPFNRFHEPERFHNAQKMTSSGLSDASRLTNGQASLPPRPTVSSHLAAESKSAPASAPVAKNNHQKAPKSNAKSDTLALQQTSSEPAHAETYQAKPRSEEELSDEMNKATGQPAGEVRVRLPSPSKDAKAATSKHKLPPVAAISAIADAEKGSTSSGTIINTPPSPLSDAEQDHGTVIRHKRKQSRKRLPSGWLPGPPPIPAAASSPERHPTETTAADPSSSKPQVEGDLTHLDLPKKGKGKKRRSISSTTSPIPREGSPVSVTSSQQTVKASDTSQPVSTAGGGATRKKSKKFKKPKARTDSAATDGRYSPPQDVGAEMYGTVTAQAIPPA